MVRPSVPSNPDAFKLIKALELFAQTFGSSQSQLELQAAIGALAVVMDLNDGNLNVLVHQVTSYYQQTQLHDKSVEAANDQISTAIIQTAKERLTDTEETLILLIRTYLQRVSAKLSAIEFIELTKAAIALLDHSSPDPKQPAPQLSLPERKRLLYIAVQTFSNQLSQPIPVIGETVPKPIARLLARLVRHQKIIRTDGVKAVFAKLVAQTLAAKVPGLSLSLIRTALKNDHITIAPDLDTQDGLDDFARVLWFETQLQMPSPKGMKSAKAIAEQVNQAIADFKARYQPLADVTQPRWDNELSVSSPFFTPSNLEITSNEFTWPPQSYTPKTLKDETNS